MPKRLSNTAGHGNVLNIQIETRRLVPTSRAITNFDERLPAPGSDLARQLLEAPYRFDFLDLGQEADERELQRDGALATCTLTTADRPPGMYQFRNCQR